MKVKKSGFFMRLLGLDEPEKPVVPSLDPEMLVRLYELCAKHAFVDVRFLNREGMSYQSLIIDVDAKRRTLLIDELYPLDESTRIVAGEEVEVTSVGKGLPVKFTSTVSALELYDGSPAYRLELPNKVKSDQRREFFRIPVTREMDIRLHVPVEETLVFSTVLNISSTGIGFKIDRNVSDQIRSNRVIRNAKITLPESIALYCDLEVRSYDYKKSPDRYTLVGAKVLNFSPSEQKIFDKFLLQLQREVNRS
jgi:c-di-GMP-binding flagellar brake protein YcgR